MKLRLGHTLGFSLIFMGLLGTSPVQSPSSPSESSLGVAAPLPDWLETAPWLKVWQSSKASMWLWLSWGGWIDRGQRWVVMESHEPHSMGLIPPGDTWRGLWVGRLSKEGWSSLQKSCLQLWQTSSKEPHPGFDGLRYALGRKGGGDTIEWRFFQEPLSKEVLTCAQAWETIVTPPTKK